MSDIKAQDNTYVSQIHKKTTIWNEDYGSQRLTSDRLGWESATPPRRNRWAHTRACNCTSSQFRRPRSTCCPSVGSRSWKSLRTHRANTISNLIDSQEVYTLYVLPTHASSHPENVSYHQIGTDTWAHWRCTADTRRSERWSRASNCSCSPSFAGDIPICNSVVGIGVRAGFGGRAQWFRTVYRLKKVVKMPHRGECMYIWVKISGRCDALSPLYTHTHWRWHDLCKSHAMRDVWLQWCVCVGVGIENVRSECA